MRTKRRLRRRPFCCNLKPKREFDLVAPSLRFLLFAKDRVLMSHASVVMVRCPKTGQELSTGVETDSETFERLPDIRAQIKCPVCNLDHNWSTREAWLGNPTPSVPSLPWLFINNQGVAND
jgi:hypothetical protein